MLKKLGDNDTEIMHILPLASELMLNCIYDLRNLYNGNGIDFENKKEREWIADHFITFLARMPNNPDSK